MLIKNCLDLTLSYANIIFTLPGIKKPDTSKINPIIPPFQSLPVNFLFVFTQGQISWLYLLQTLT